jgi:hypothetical protein
MCTSLIGEFKSSYSSGIGVSKRDLFFIVIKLRWSKAHIHGISRMLHAASRTHRAKRLARYTNPTVGLRKSTDTISVALTRANILHGLQCSAASLRLGLVLLKVLNYGCDFLMLIFLAVFLQELLVVDESGFNIGFLHFHFLLGNRAGWCVY